MGISLGHIGALDLDRLAAMPEAAEAHHLARGIGANPDLIGGHLESAAIFSRT